MSIADNLSFIKSKITRVTQTAGREEGVVTLLPVTKSVGVAEVKALYAAGCRSFGENRIDVLNEKKDSFDPEVCWHFIGTLQRKKIRKILASSTVLHAVDSLKLAQKISRVAGEMGIQVQIFLEVNNGEEQKGGFDHWQIKSDFPIVAALENITIIGLMTMAPFSDDRELIRQSFRKTRLLQDELNNSDILPAEMKQLSMGMSNDFEIAIEEGSTLVRVGTALYI